MSRRPPSTEQILIVENDVDEAARLRSILEDCGYAVTHSLCGQPAIDALESEVYDTVLLCACAPGSKGLFVLSHAQSIQTQAQFLVLTDDDSIDTAVEAMKLGAFDYLRTPVNPDLLILRLERALREAALNREVAQLRHTMDGADHGLIGSTPAMERVFRLMKQVSPTRSSVLLVGETGTGKELIAKAIHQLSPRRKHPFITVSCSSLPENLLESELFGHVKGSFTGAVANRRGLFQDASGGTAFLDEVETLSTPVQTKLLRAIEARTIQRVGSNEEIPVDFRLITASNADLSALVDRKLFRADLFYRLNVFPIKVPPLRERANDIPLLAVHFRDHFAKEDGLDPVRIGPQMMTQLMEYWWPGNVRELRNVIERATIISNGRSEMQIELPSSALNEDGTSLACFATARWSLKQLEDAYIPEVLSQEGDNRNSAARVLGIDRRTLYRKLREIQPEVSGAEIPT